MTTPIQACFNLRRSGDRGGAKLAEESVGIHTVQGPPRRHPCESPSAPSLITSNFF